MTTPTIRAALDTFQQAANSGIAVHVSSAIVQELREALEAGSKEIGLPPGYIDPEHVGEDRELLETFYRAANAEGGTADEIHLRGIRAVLARWGTLAAAPVPAPSSEALAAPVAWCRSDDFLAALLNRQSFSGWRDQHPDCDMALYAHPQASAAPPAPEPGEVGELVDWIHRQAVHGPDADAWRRALTLLQRQAAELAALWGVLAPEPGEAGELAARLTLISEGICAKDPDLEEDSWFVARAAIVIAQQAAELTVLRGVPVAVSERPWEREGWCDPGGRCWLGSVGSRGNDPGWVYRKPCKILHQTISLPHNAIPLPAPQAGEAQP